MKKKRINWNDVLWAIAFEIQFIAIVLLAVYR